MTIAYAKDWLEQDLQDWPVGGVTSLGVADADGFFTYEGAVAAW